MVRESAYPYALPSPDFLASLEDCVQATEACCSTLQRGLERLEPGTRDLPRLSRILRNKHPIVQAHRTALSSAFAPQIDQLLARAERQLTEDKARVARLEERLAILQSARLPQESSITQEEGLDIHAAGGESEEGGAASNRLEGLDMKELNPAQRRKVIMLRGKRERLEKERDRLQGHSAP